MVTAFHQGEPGLGAGVLAFAEETKNKKAASYLTARPVTVTEGDIIADPAISEGFKTSEWHHRNMSGGPLTHYLVDGKGDTVKIKISRPTHRIRCR